MTLYALAPPDAKESCKMIHDPPENPDRHQKLTNLSVENRHSFLKKSIHNFLRYFADTTVKG